MSNSRPPEQIGRPSTSLGHRTPSRNSHGKPPKRSATPLGSSSRSSDRRSDKTPGSTSRDVGFQGRRNKSSNKPRVAPLEHIEEEDGGVSLGGSAPGDKQQRDQHQSVWGDNNNTAASDDFNAQPGHSFWTWSVSQQNWWHRKENGEILWAEDDLV
jgi:hypothetical protein